MRPRCSRSATTARTTSRSSPRTRCSRPSARILDAADGRAVGIAAISLTVAGIGIMNVMLVSVSERTREIGLLKAVGVGRRQVVAVFLVEAALLLSTAGGVLGLAVGLVAVTGLLRGLYPAFPAQPPLWAVGAALSVSISVGLALRRRAGASRRAPRPGRGPGAAMSAGTRDGGRPGLGRRRGPPPALRADGARRRRSASPP